jgi:hypothetical protein
MDSKTEIPDIPSRVAYLFALPFEKCLQKMSQYGGSHTHSYGPFDKIPYIQIKVLIFRWQ